jgi:hypothetical protein
MNPRDLMIGMALGAALAFAGDPAAGRRRRARARDQLVRASRRTRDALDTTTRDVVNRTTGIVATARGRFRDDHVDDPTLVERVRAKLGRICSHPRAIDVHAADGNITLRGPILARELERVIETVAAVRGVRGVSDELEPHESAEGIPSLQGPGHAMGPRLDVLQRTWAPATQALVAAGVAATGLCVAAFARR